MQSMEENPRRAWPAPPSQVLFMWPAVVLKERKCKVLIFIRHGKRF